MSIMNDPTSTHQSALTIIPLEMDQLVARLKGRVLYLDPTSPVEDQLDALADAVDVLRGGRASWGRRVRHLSVVAS